MEGPNRPGDAVYWHRLPDGRRLTYAEFGDPQGHPIVYCHGVPGCRLEVAYAAEVARRRGLRLISPDRPGVGGSDPDPDRTLASWPADVASLADALELPHFAVLGVSGGAPYVLACLARIPNRLMSVDVVGGLVELAGSDLQAFTGLPRVAFGLARRAAQGSRYHQALFRSFSRTMAQVLWYRPTWVMATMKRPLDPVDKETLNRPDVADVVQRTLHEAARQRKAQGNAHDLRLYVQPWNFDFPQQGVPVRFWHGERDHVVPYRLAERQAERVPGARLTLFPDEGHYSLPVRREEVLEAVQQSFALGLGPRSVETG